MKIEGCISCGNCFEFISESRCPTGSFVVRATSGYAAAEIKSTCIDCGLCRDEVECLGECIKL